MSLVIEIPAPTLITEGSRIQGNLTFLSATQIHGLVEGDVEQQSLEPVQVGRTGWVKGAVRSAGPVVVDGRVDGDIVSATKIRLSATACVHGALSAPHIEVRPGAIFEGDFNMKAKVLAAKPSKKAAAA